jgi:hypothetical protein
LQPYPHPRLLGLVLQPDPRLLNLTLQPDPLKNIIICVIIITIGIIINIINITLELIIAVRPKIFRSNFTYKSNILKYFNFFFDIFYIKKIKP